MNKFLLPALLVFSMSVLGCGPASDAPAKVNTKKTGTSASGG